MCIRDSPLFELAPERMPEVRESYAWYVRCPDPAGFLRRVAPVLERRLRDSTLARHSGILALNLYRSGIRLVFEGGQLAAVEAWMPDTEHVGDVAVPELVFLQLLFGFRNFAELERGLPDAICWRDAVRPLLAALFPRRPSWLWCTA